MNLLLELTKDTILFFFELAKLLLWLLPILFFGYFIIVHLIYYLLPDLTNNLRDNPIVSLTNKEIGNLIIFVLILSVLGIVIRFIERKFILSNPLRVKWEMILAYAVTAYLLGLFFSKTYTNGSLQNQITLFFGIIFFLLLPQLVKYYSTFDFTVLTALGLKKIQIPKIPEIKMPMIKMPTIRMPKIDMSIIQADLRKLFSQPTDLNVYKIALKKIFEMLIIFVRRSMSQLLEKTIAIFRRSLRILTLLPDILLPIIVRGFILVSFILFVILIVGVLGVKLQEYAAYQKKLRESLYIKEITPNKTTFAEKIILFGYNFGWKINNEDAVMSDYGKITVDEWTNERITFNVPFEWKEGKVNIWIERCNRSETCGKLEESNKEELELVSRWEYYPTLEELESKDLRSLIWRAVKKIRRQIINRNFNW